MIPKGLITRAFEKFSDWTLPNEKIVPKQAIIPVGPKSYRDYPAPDYHQIALRQVAKEGEFADVLHAELIERCPTEGSLVRKVVRELRNFSNTGVTSQEGVQKMRMLYFKTHGLSNDIIKKYMSALFPKPALPDTISSIYGQFGSAEVKGIVDELSQHGVYRLKQSLPRQIIEQISSDLNREAGRDNMAGLEKRNEAFVSYREDVLLKSAALKALGSDPLFYHVAAEYLDTQPLLQKLYAWNSYPHTNQGELLSKNAQQFHVDMSHPGFLNIFIYLNDVDSKNGPHCMIPGTHKVKAKPLWRDERLGDDEVASFYPRNTWAYQLGKAGSVFLVDTRSFHKGEPLIEGERRICQLHYTNTLFGDPIAAPGTPDFKPSDFTETPLDYAPRFFERYALNL